MDELELIKQKINLVDLISENLTLKKAGRNFKALCPFHGEKTPSFVISPERQIWHCFGCSRGGDIFGYLMELDHLEFPEALKILANRAGVKLTRYVGTSQESALKDKLLEIHHLAQEFYHFILTKHKLGDRARNYLKQRGVTDKAIVTFGLGFAPASWDNLGRFLIKKGYKPNDIEIAGLISKGRTGFYDRFRDRIMFPLQNHRSETIAFAGRVLNPDIKEAKYINSPETPIYIKGNTLYGLNITKEAIKKEGSAIIVEGEFDLISSFQAGVSNVVAIKGSALTLAQVNLIKRFTDRLILSLDKDLAGDQAARRGIEIADQNGLDIRVVTIPNGKDPDEAAREDAVAWKKAVKKAVPFYEFLINSAFSRFTDNDIYAKKKIAEELLPIFAKISNPVIQGHYLKNLSERLVISEEKLNEGMQKIRITLPIARKIQAENKISKNHEDLLEEHLLSMVLQAKDIAVTLHQVTEKIDPSDFHVMPVKKIFMELIDLCSQNQTININDFSQKLPSEIVPTLDTAYLRDLPVFPDEDEYQKELVKTINATKVSILRQKIKTLSEAITKAHDQSDENTLKDLKIRLHDLVADLKALS